MDPDVNIVKRQMTEEETSELNYEPPYLRAKVASYEREVANLKADNSELTTALYDAYDRIRQLNETLDKIQNPATISGDEKSW